MCTTEKPIVVCMHACGFGMGVWSLWTGPCYANARLVQHWGSQHTLSRKLAFVFISTKLNFSLDMCSCKGWAGGANVRKQHDNAGYDCLLRCSSSLSLVMSTFVLDCVCLRWCVLGVVCALRRHLCHVQISFDVVLVLLCLTHSLCVVELCISHVFNQPAFNDTELS